MRLSQAAMDDYRKAEGLEPKVHLLMDFATALTLDPHFGGEPAIAALREAGWSDEAILEAIETIGFFNYYNRMVDALGIEPEPEWDNAREA